MPYASQAQLTERYGEAMLIAATDRGPVPTGAPDASVIAQALGDADAVIDGYLTGRYALPLASVPSLLTDIARSIAIWKLHPYDTPQKLKDEHDGAMRMLRDLADGRVKLSLAGVETPTVDRDGVRITDRERPLTEENMRGFI